MSFQSTRPRGARPRAHGRDRQVHVSIHAPARGATPRNLRYIPVWIVSIHAPARGATRLTRTRLLSSGSFNPRARAGRDTCTLVSCRHEHEFQSTRPRGARLCFSGRHLDECRFQSTRPRGARPEGSSGSSSNHSFQSTRPRGARLHRIPSSMSARVSIHAPARGATSRQANADHHLQFQSTRPRGARQTVLVLPDLDECFNPRARAGRDLRIGILRSVEYCFNPRARAGRDMEAHSREGRRRFQSTRPRGARPVPSLDPRQSSPVSIHAPARGATTFP